MNYDNTIKGAIFGHVIGDAMGVPVEFVPREIIEENPVDQMREYGTHYMPKGTWSDDSSMMLGTLASIIEMNTLDLNDIMERFAQWAKNGYMTPHGKPFGIGRSTLKAIGKYWKGENAVRCGCNSEKDNGNGSLMRILPIAMYYSLGKPELEIEDKIELIHRVSSLTHSHQRACIACGIYYFVFDELVHTPEKVSILVGLQKAGDFYKTYEDFSHYQRLRSHFFFDLARDEIKSSGYVVDTLEAALWSLYHSSSYAEVIVTAVNLGGDTDTIAAIAGGLAGVLYGFDDIPNQWVVETVKNEMIMEMCEDFTQSISLSSTK